MKETKYYPELWYKIDFTNRGHALDFEATKISALVDEDISKSDFDSEPELTGTMKWDGCVNFKHEAHYCEVQEAIQANLLWIEIYKYAKENIEGNDIDI